MERGEVEGRVSITWTSLKTGHVDWIKNNRINIIAQMALQRDPELLNTPNILELVKNSQDRQVFEFLFARQEAGRPYVAPPSVPAARVKLLRDAFSAAANDQEFMKDIVSRGGSIELMTGSDLQALITRMYQTPFGVLNAVRQALEQ
jgi:hypothetical protein